MNADEPNEKTAFPHAATDQGKHLLSGFDPRPSAFISG
jgi:hypothetical protein